MAEPAPVYRVCYCGRGGEWRPYVTRTRNPDPIAARLRREGWRVLVQVRPPRGVPFPVPGPCMGLRVAP